MEVKGGSSTKKHFNEKCIARKVAEKDRMADYLSFMNENKLNLQFKVPWDIIYQKDDYLKKKFVFS